MSAEDQSSSSHSSSTSSTSLSFKPLNLEKSRYDQSSYTGRIRHFLDVIDPFTLLTTDTQLQSSLQLIEKYKTNPQDPSLKGVSEEELWSAKKQSDAIIHPDSKEKVFILGRMSAFVPCNLLLTYGMLTASTAGTNIFWQWMNQTYNVVMNYSNRSIQKGSTTQYSELLGPYAGAVGVSCTLVLTLRKAAESISKNPAIPSAAKFIASILVPYTAVASAGAANVIFMRYPETQKGVEVKNQRNEVLGISKVAGYEGVKMTALTRLLLPVPILIAPPVIMKAIESTGVLQNRPKLRIPVFLTVITGCLWAALPLAIALFPQTAEIDVKKLEKEFQEKKDPHTGKPYEKLFFNKGL